MTKQSFPIPEGCKAVTVEQTGQNIITTFDSATEKQIGGTHYKTAIQPVEYIHANGLNFFEGNVIKYITRHRSKGGRADLEEAMHYIEMLIQFEYSDKSETDRVEQSPKEKIPDDAVIEKGIFINGDTYPLNPDAYITEREKALSSCEGCIFKITDGRCSVSQTKLTIYCTINYVIYKSLKQ